MARQDLDLGGSIWQFGQVFRRSFAAVDVNDLANVTEWLPAAVPGNVRTDLLALGRIPNPFFAEGYKDSLWVEEVDWWYRRRLDIAPLAPGQRAFLVFAGIDYLSAVFINGQERMRHEGMFSPQQIEITDALQTGRAEIAVRLWGSSALPRRQLNWFQRGWQKFAGSLANSWTGVYPERSAVLKCQMSFGWDFAPPIRTMGIWDGVRLIVSGPVFIVSASAAGQPQLPVDLGAPGSPVSKAPAVLSVRLTLNTGCPHQVKVAIRVTPANFAGPAHGPFNFSLHLPDGLSEHRLTMSLAEAALWHPWDRGKPCLYNLEITVADPEGHPLDTLTHRTGIRRVEWRNWQCFINGQSEFMRGLNWVPADSFPGRLRRERYDYLLRLARDSGANLLRVWGGGLREKASFYDLCDELGLLVWQEFPFACMFLGAYPRDRAYLALVAAECGAIVQQLRHHPALVLWCGGNEFSRRRNRPVLKTLAALAEQHDRTRPFVPVSPSFGHGGDRHNWLVWHGGAPIRAYQAETAAFLSEFGMQALPHAETMAAALPDPARNWQTHHADQAKLRQYLAPFLVSSHSAGPPPDISPTSLPAWITASQRAQAAALQTAIEHMRRRKEQVGGVCIWQFNEPWPAISWAIVDYFGRPKLAYKGLRCWYQPLLVSLKFTVGLAWQKGQVFNAEIWGINDSDRLVKGELQVLLDGVLIHSQSIELVPGSAKRAGLLRHVLQAAPGSIRLILYQEQRILAENLYDLRWADPSSSSFYQRLRRWLADAVLH